jgi:hypothetical protein
MAGSRESGAERETTAVGRGGEDKRTPGVKISVPIRHGKTVFKTAKYTIFGLLVVDMLVYLWGSTLNEALDSVGWLFLLGAFEYESTSLHENYASTWEKYLLMAVQTVGYGITLKVTITYGVTHEWLDLANSILWLLVCASIAYDIYAPGDYEGAEWRVRNALKMTLYMALVAIAITWGVEGAWLDFYDAALWILCFAVVELNIFEFEEAAATEPSAAK